MITQAELKELLNYDQETGIFTWSIKPRRGINIGDIAGSKRKHDGYVAIRIQGKQYYAHKLAWLYVHNVWSTQEIDHINRIRDDNRLSNLRELSPALNSQNRNKKITNTSGYTGVYWCKNSKKWKSQISYNSIRKHLGSFNNIKDAYEAYLIAKEQYHHA